MKKVVWFFTNHSYRNTYLLITLMVAVSYYFVRQLMNNMEAFGFVMSSQLTFNIVIMFGLWGGCRHLVFKVKNPYLDVVVLVGGFMLIVLICRVLGDMKTIFG